MKKEIAIIGGGACALMLGAELDPKLFNVSIYEKNNALGRKFLVAGDGGLNLTHSEDPLTFIERYTPTAFLRKPFQVFSNRDLIKWLEAAGIDVFAGTSGRIFPIKKWKPIDVLNVFLKKIEKNGAKLYFKHTWKGFGIDGALKFNTPTKDILIKPDLVVFCLGGASWPVTGSAGEWLSFFQDRKINIVSFYASNCSNQINWPEGLIDKIEGKALKNISLSCGTLKHFGEVVVTKFGLEGSGIYPLSPAIRGSLKEKGKAEIFLDLKPSMSLENIISKLKIKKGSKSYSEHISSTLNLSPTQVKLLKGFLSKEEFTDIEKLAVWIKNFPLTIVASGPLEDAISSVGGIALDEINDEFELKKLPGNYCIGEMLDYDAPTGGYLLQSCFTMAKYLADQFNDLSHKKGKSL